MHDGFGLCLYEHAIPKRRGYSLFQFLRKIRNKSSFTKQLRWNGTARGVRGSGGARPEPLILDGTESEEIKGVARRKERAVDPAIKSNASTAGPVD